MIASPSDQRDVPGARSSSHEQSDAAASQPRSLADRLTALYAAIVERIDARQSTILARDPDGLCSSHNLLAYLALREHDLYDLQAELAALGLSSLGRVEASVLASLHNVMQHVGAVPRDTTCSMVDHQRAYALLAERGRALLGRPRADRRTRIMVTADAAMLAQRGRLEQLLIEGMDVVRINCAHGTADDWRRIVEAVRRAEARLTVDGPGARRRCRVVMDLAGPKVRTGPLAQESKPLKLSVPKDAEGRPSRLLEGLLDSRASFTERLRSTSDAPQFVLAVSGQATLSSLRVGEQLYFEDTRRRTRVLYVLERMSDTQVRVGLERTAYVPDGLVLRREEGAELTLGPVAPQPVDLRVQAGDRLYLYRDATVLGHPARLTSPAGIGCTLPEALVAVQPGHRVYIDDGKIAASAVSIRAELVEVEVIAPRGVAARVKAWKGLNFPDSTLRISALTDDDRAALDTVVQCADAVGLSFVHRPEDVADLRAALAQRGKPDLGVILKIETRDAVHHLAQLLLAGLAQPNLGIMIARGDLAVEVGFEHLARIQDDVLCLCEAAHVPVIWATQVLETLAKSGLPARAEITDAAMGHRAECVMLNKGEHIREAVATLAYLLAAEEPHHVKKRDVYREFTAQALRHDA